MLVNRKALRNDPAQEHGPTKASCSGPLSFLSILRYTLFYYISENINE